MEQDVEGKDKGTCEGLGNLNGIVMEKARFGQKHLQVQMQTVFYLPFPLFYSKNS
jgi:hypothetical protein